MESTSSTSRPSSPSCADGFSLIELMIAMALTLSVAAAAISLTTATRQIFEADKARNHVTRSMRISKDFLTVDVRQAGERLDGLFPAVEVIQGDALPGGKLGDPDRLVLRRNTHPTVLRVCRELGGTDRNVYYEERETTPAPAGCAPLPDGDGDGRPDAVDDWRAERLATDIRADNGRRKMLYGFVYDPVQRRGEFFRIFNESKRGWIRTHPGQSWQYVYPLINQPRMYLLEERRYDLIGDTLVLTINGDETRQEHLTDKVADFQLQAQMHSGSPRPSFGPGDAWHDLRAIEVSLRTSTTVGGEVFERSTTITATPRNVMSR